MLLNRLIGAQSSGAFSTGIIGLSGGVNTQALAAHANATHYALACAQATSPNKGVVALLTRDGTLQWQRAISAAVNVTPYAVKIDMSGNVFVLCNVSDATANVVLLKYNSSGTLQWQRKVSSANAVRLAGAAQQCLQVASDGSVYVYVRKFSTPAEAALLKYNSSGTLQWQRKWADANANSPIGFTIDSSGNLYVSFGYGPVGNNTLQLRKLDSFGAQTASRRMENQSWNSGAGALHFSGSDVFVAGGIGFAIGACIYRLNSSLTYQASRVIASSAYIFRDIGVGGGALLLTKSDNTGYLTAATSPDVTTHRLVTSSLGASTAVSASASDATLLVASGSARLSSASYLDAMLLCLDPAADTGTFAPVTVASDSLTDSAGTDITYAGSGPDAAAASLTDEAASLTDAAGALTVTLYS